MPCSTSCMISIIFLVGMIYFYIRTYNSKIVKEYKNTLTPDLKKRYDKISKERLCISTKGYLLGLLLSLIIILNKKNLSTTSLVCIVVATSFLTNYFYYMLHPKSDWMLNHMESEQQVKNWVVMYREMSYNYHSGLVLGIIAVGIFAYAFRGVKC
jgi:uncharacterized protein YacL